MKKLTLSAFAVISVSLCSAQNLQEKDVPAVVRSAFQKQYPGVKADEWDKEGVNYEVEFKVQEAEQSLLIDPMGTILETEIEINISSLPETAREYVSKNYAGQSITEAAKITDAKGKVTYEAEVKGKDLLFDGNGNFIKAADDGIEEKEED